MALESDDSDIQQTWLKSYFSGNGDIYIEIIYRDHNNNKMSTAVRIATSGGCAPTKVKLAAAELARAMMELDLNEMPDRD